MFGLRYPTCSGSSKVGSRTITNSKPSIPTRDGCHYQFVFVDLHSRLMVGYASMSLGIFRMQTA